MLIMNQVGDSWYLLGNSWYYHISPFPSDTLTMPDMGCTIWGPRTNCLTKSKVYSSRDSMWRDIFVGYGMDSGPTSSSSLLTWDKVIVLVGNWNNPEVEYICFESLGTEAPYLLQGWVGPDWIRRRGQLHYQTAPVSQGGVKGSQCSTVVLTLL